MRWVNGRQSGNVEDQRGGGSRGGLAVGGGIGTLVIMLAAYFFGVDPRVIMEQVPTGPAPSTQTGGRVNRPVNSEEENLKKLVSLVLADTEDVWHELLRQKGLQYREPKLVLFSGQVRSACGITGSAVGPFYCPGDEKLYLDLSFYRQLSTQFQAPGDFAQAYVIAHEVGHHVQNLLGTTDKVQALQGRVSKADANRLSVRLELQADFFAGVWAHYAKKRGILETGDLEEGLQAASAIGDDRMQMENQGYAVPDSFTHGTSEQRSRWFQRGLETGDILQGNTFSDKM